MVTTWKYHDEILSLSDLIRIKITPKRRSSGTIHYTIGLSIIGRMVEKYTVFTVAPKGALVYHACARAPLRLRSFLGVEVGGGSRRRVAAWFSGCLSVGPIPKPHNTFALLRSVGTNIRRSP